MKKAVLYIVVFLVGISIGYFFYLHKNVTDEKKETVENTFLASRQPFEDRKKDFMQSAPSMLGEPIMINGEVQEVYKNSKNEIVLYLKDSNIPITINCTLINSEFQVKEPFSLGERVNLQGIFTQLGEEMFLEGCRLLYRAPLER